MKSLATTLFFMTSVYGATINVPGTSNPWLAGMPAGSTAGGGDTAPAQSPVLMTGISLGAGSSLLFSVTGFASNGPCCALVGPDGEPLSVMSAINAPENGIANLTSPINALLGVFLDASQPNLSAAPSDLDFSTSASRDYLSFSPLLRQVFFIGDGLTSTSSQQAIVVPVGATRLFLGTMDGFEWVNNLGSFDVTATAAVPEPGSLLVLASGLALLGCLRRRC